ncbi:MAG TPA: PQQ-binding-like beta-propeller repeat protein [Steroidobacteraceae bacterium]|nr:PQQ-binding-like beta-propeller repeat protein [Steroidobacteraceae bacterium]
MSSRCYAFMATLLVAGSWTLAHANEPSARASVDGEAVFRRVCAVCHLGLNQMGPMAGINPLAGAGATHAPPREFLQNLPPEAILNALTNGKMQAQGAALTPPQRRAVAEYVSGHALGAKPLDPAIERGKPCTSAPPMSDPARGAGWNGWGNGIANTRFQTRERGGLSAADLPRLELKWAFGFVNVASVRTQPAVVGGRLFVASENGQVHALDPKSGCTYWSYAAHAGVGTALSVGRYRSARGTRGYALYFADRKTNAYAVDAETGREIWVRNLDRHPSASITGAPTVYDGRVFVPVQGVGEEGGAARGDYACCTFRGSVSALDASTGALLWKTYTVGESRPRAKNKDGVQLYGPAGGGIWSAPTVDPQRGLVYVATGNGYADPPQSTTDAVLALDIRTGAVRWARQVLANDIWVMGCEAHNSPDKPTCPPTLGPDYDFSASPALARIAGRELLVLPQKSGLAFALDPAQRGRIVWRYRIGKGSGFGGEWGTAIEGSTAYFGVADLLTSTPGGVHAVQLADGSPRWHMPPPKPFCAGRLICSVGQGAALTAIPGAVLSGAMDGGVRAYSTTDGSVLWAYDCNRAFATVNGVPAHGGGIDGPGPIVAGGMLYVTSGAGGLMGSPGNVLLAFGLP